MSSAPRSSRKPRPPSVSRTERAADLDRGKPQPAPSIARCPCRSGSSRSSPKTGPDRLSFSELATQLHSRAWGGLLFIFAAINVLPLPPGTSAFFALPILIVSAQMIFGRASPWFPARIDRRGVKKHELQRLIAKMEWLELRVERIFKPRLPTLTGPPQRD